MDLTQKEEQGTEYKMGKTDRQWNGENTIIFDPGGFACL